MIGQKYPVDVQNVTCPDTGARVTRYVHETGDDQHFYYSQPSITADGRKLVFWSSVSGRYEIHAIDIAVGADCSVQLTDGASFVADHPCVDWVRNLIFYNSGRRIMRTDIDTAETDWVYEVPEGFRPMSLSSNGRYVAFSFIRRMNPGRTRHDDEILDGRPQLYLRPTTLIMAVEIETSKAHYVWGDHNYLTHVQISPVEPELVMFCDQSTANWQSEIYLVPIKLTDDKVPLRLFENNSQRLIYVGHEWFTQDGWVATQMMEYTGITDRWNNYTDKVGFNAIVQPDGTNMRRARFPGRLKPVHVHGPRTDSWWVGDTMPLARSEDMDRGMMCLIQNHWEYQGLDLWPLYRHNHSHERPFHVHPWVDNDEKKVVFACRHQGRNAIHILDLKAFLEDKNLPRSPKGQP